MDLPNLFTASVDAVSRPLLCIILTDASVQALLLQVSVQGTRIVKKSKVVLYTDQANCVLKTDETLQELSPEADKVNEVLFGLEQAWLKGNAIAEAKKSVLHQITTDLSLKPLGFVVQSEALFQHHLSHNSHVSTILLVFSEQFLTALVVTQGELKLTETIGRSDDVVADCKEALARYTAKYEGTYLPAKIVCASFVLSEPELYQYQQTLLDVEWGDNFPFVQKPTIDVMRPELAISLIAQQAGQAIAATLSQINATESPETAVEPSESSDTMGFTPISTAEVKNIPTDAQEKNTATSFGIPIKSELIHTTHPHKDSETAVELDEGDEESPGILQKLLGPQPARIGKDGRPVRYNPRTFILGGVIAGILALLAISIFFVFFFTQVTAVIVPKSQPITEEVKLMLDPEAQASDPQNLIIPGEAVSKSLTKDATIPTTGVKIVGDKASGEVVIYNKTEAEKKFPAGTVVALETLQFVTDSEVTVPAAVVTEKPGGKDTDYGEAKVAVTAYLIGVEGNISKEKDMTVGDFDKNTYSARSTVDFAGGSSREVRVVAEADQKEAVTEAKRLLLEQANIEFKQDSKDGKYFVPTESIKVTSTTYSAELENEAEELTVSIAADVIALSYNKDDLSPIAQALLAKKVPEGYVLSDSAPEILSVPVQAADSAGKVEVKANISSFALPQFDEEALKQDLAGKPVDEALTQLQTKQGVKSASFVFYPSWASGLVGKLPSSLERITIQQVAE